MPGVDPRGVVRPSAAPGSLEALPAAALSLDLVDEISIAFISEALDLLPVDPVAESSFSCRATVVPAGADPQVVQVLPQQVVELSVLQQPFWRRSPVAEISTLVPCHGTAACSLQCSPPSPCCLSHR